MALGSKAPVHRDKARNATRYAEGLIKRVNGKLDAGNCTEAYHSLSAAQRAVGEAIAHRQSASVRTQFPGDKLHAAEARFRAACIRR